MSALLRRITSKYEVDFYCINCFHSYSTKEKLKRHKEVCENYDYCFVEMPKEDNKVLKYNHGEKPMKVPFIIYAVVESLIEKMSNSHNNPEKSSSTKINKHTAPDYSLFTHCSFDTTKNKLDYNRGKNCTKNFCLDLKERAKKKNLIMKKKEMILFSIEENESYLKQEVCYICKKEFIIDDDNGIAFNKKYHKVRDHCHYTGIYRGAPHSTGNLRYKTPKEISVDFIMVLHIIIIFIIKELTKEFEGKFECLGENTEKYITFSVPIKKNDNGKSITYKIKFIDSSRFIQVHYQILLTIYLKDFIMIFAYILNLV